MTKLRQPPRIGWTPATRRHFDLAKAALVLIEYGTACAFRERRDPAYLQRVATAAGRDRKALTRDYTDVIVTGLREPTHTGHSAGAGAVTWNTDGVKR